MKNYLIYPTKIMSITQNYADNFSHKPNSDGKPIYDYPIDENCGTTGRDYFCCPCDEVEIKRIYGVGSSGANTIWLQSTSKVVFANGEEDYCTILVTHPNDDTLKSLKVGQTFKRKEKMFLEGKDGNATGNHFHISVAKGKFVYSGWKKNNLGSWCITGKPIKPEEAFFIDREFTTIKKTAGLKFKDMPKIEMPKPVEKDSKVTQVEVIVDKLRARTTPKIASDNIIGFVEKGYYNILSIDTDAKYDWYEVEKDKWIADDGTFLNIHKKEEEPPTEEPKIEDTLKPQNKPDTEPKDEGDTNITPNDESSQCDKDNWEYYSKKEESNPLLCFFEWLFKFIKRIFIKKS